MDFPRRNRGGVWWYAAHKVAHGVLTGLRPLGTGAFLHPEAGEEVFHGERRLVAPTEANIP